MDFMVKFERIVRKAESCIQDTLSSRARARPSRVDIRRIPLITEYFRLRIVVYNVYQ